MMNYIWAAMLVLSLITAIFTGNTQALSEGFMRGAADSVELLLSILGIMCFWSGMMEIAKESGITDLLSKLFSPVLRLIFPRVPKDSPAMRSMSLNISANLLGLGNAATPFGIEAMKELRRENNNEDFASDSMVLFVVLNTASLQLIPTTIAAYRQSYGSESPFDIILCVWVTSICALVVGVAFAKAISLGSAEGKNPLKSLRRQKVWN